MSTNKWTRHWPWLLALVCAVITTFTAASAYRALTTEPQHQLTIRIDGEHEWNISQSTVDAVLQEPIRSWRPLELTVTDRWLTGDELLRGEVSGTDILLSTRLGNRAPDTDYRVSERFSGTGFNRSLVGDDTEYTDKRFDIHNGFRDNLGLGHGPAAVVAAGEQAAAVLGDKPVTNPTYWLAGIGLGAMATFAFLALGLRRRRRQTSREQRLRAAGRKLARVVLDLEALEVTYRATPEGRRPGGFTEAWRRLEALSLEAARCEQQLLRDVASPGFVAELAGFERDCRELTELADALLGAGSVHAELAGTGSTFDRLSQPVNAAVLELLNRLRHAPGRMVSQEQLQSLREALDRLISVANNADDSRAAIESWSRAEAALARTVRDLNAWLRRYPHIRLAAPTPAESTELLKLRESLGMKPDRRERALVQLGYANARVRAILGDLPGDTAPAPPGRIRTWVSGLARGQRTGGDEPDVRRRWWRIGVAAVLLIGAMIVSGVVITPYSQRPQGEEDRGSRALELVIDGVHEQVVESDIRRYMDVQFPQAERITIAVRDAGAYLEYDPEDPDYLVPRNIPEILWRLKHEFSDKVDPETGELFEGEAIIPAMIFENGELAIPGMASWQLARGEYGWGQPVRWEHGSIRSSSYGGITLANMIDDYAEALVRNDARRPDFSVSALFWTLTAMIWLTGLNAVLLVRFLLGATTSLGRLGRYGRRLRAAQRDLGQLALGLDESRLNTVAVLGAGPPGTAAEAGQRLHERALAMAWREAEELASIPLAERYSGTFGRRVRHLEKLVQTLGRHEVDAAVRAQQLIAATRGAGGGTPGPQQLPG